jgi:hypothetical protein
MRSVSVFLAIIFLNSISCVFADNQIEYLAVLIDGGKVGHAVSQRIIKDSQVTTSEWMYLDIVRMGMEISITTYESYTETLDGKPLSFISIQKASGMDSSIKGTVNGDGKVDVVVSAGGMNQKKSIDYPKGALMPQGVRLFQMKRGLVEGDKFKTRMFVPSMLIAVDAEVTTGGKKTVDLFGRVVTLTEQIVTMKMQGQSLRMVSLVDSELNAMKSTLPMMGMNLELIACDKIVATSKNDIVDLIDSMLVASPVSLGDTRIYKSAQYHLLAKDGKKLDILEGENQTVETGADGKVVITVVLLKTIGSVKFPYAGDDKGALELLKPSPYLKSEHELIIKLAKQAIGDTKDTAKAALKIELFVSNYITEKDLSVGYASAVEVAQSKQGDCSEHAVLSAAMCRAVGIPARMATGLVYVEEFGNRKDVFGGHVWTEVFVGDKWMSIDATRAPNGFSVGHIKLATGNGEPSDFLEMINSLGYFQIEKVELQR